MKQQLIEELNSIAPIWNLNITIQSPHEATEQKIRNILGYSEASGFDFKSSIRDLSYRASSKQHALQHLNKIKHLFDTKMNYSIVEENEAS